MRISEELQQELSKGDLTRIAGLYAHKNDKSITPKYVGMVLRGKRNNEEIVELAEMYLECILELKRSIKPPVK